VGRRVAQQARVVSKACDDLLATCRKPEDFAGDYRIGFVLTSSIRHLPGLLARAQSEVPEVHFDVESGLSDDLLARVMTGDLDAAVITGGELPAQVASVTLTTEELVYGLPTNAANWSIKTCMARLSFIHFMPETGIGRLIARHLKEASLVPHDVIVLDSVEAVRECVSKGVGFSILPRPDIERHAGRAISIKPLAGERIERELVLVYLRGGALEPHIPVLRRLFDT
ncbi:MAG: LysR substrate-binding domain-containing protein, partial [Pseudomonadota bacterium]